MEEKASDFYLVLEHFVDYPRGLTVNRVKDTEALQANDKVYIFREGEVAMQWDGDRANHFVLVDQSEHPHGGTFIRMPKGAWGVFFQQRLIMPYKRTELIMSDKLDFDSFDSGNSKFKILQGSQDYLTGVHPFSEDQLLVFYRKSIHVIYKVSDSFDNMLVRELTRELGLISRKSIVTAGRSIYFLSDNGFYALEIGTDIPIDINQVVTKPLRGKEPLSADVQDIFDTMNTANASTSRAVYFNNRIHIAFPTGASMVNDTQMVYNLLNEKWESRDTFPPGFAISDYMITDYGNQKRLFAIDDEGGIYLLEEGQKDENGSAGDPATTLYEIAGQLITRRYRLHSPGTKQFHNGQLDLVLEAGETVDVSATSENPDSSARITTYTNVGAEHEDYTKRFDINKNGYGCEVQIDTTVGRPELRMVLVEGAEIAGDRSSYE